MLGYAFIEPHINYAFINRGSASCLKSVSQNLNKAARIMNFDKNTASSKPTFLKFSMNNLFAVQYLKMAVKKANILQHTKSFFV